MGGGVRERTSVEVRRLTSDDAGALVAFFATVPEGDRTFFKEDITQPGTVAGWVADPQHRNIALVDGLIVGYAAVLKGVAWSSHVGEIRIVVSPTHRGLGIGRLLAQRAVVEAEELGLVKLIVELVAGHDRLLAMFTGLGFVQEGRLRAHVRTASGDTRDLVVLAHFVDELAAMILPADTDASNGPADPRGTPSH